MAETLPNWLHDVEALRRFAKIRLIVIDLDGTLISSAQPNPLLNTIKDLVRSLNHHRYKVGLTIATGRTLAGVRPVLETLPLHKGVPLILYNGSLVVRNGTFKVIERRTISLESLQQIIETSSNHCVRTFAYFYNDPWFEAQDVSEHEYVMGWTSNCEPGHEFNNMPVRWLSTPEVGKTIEPSALLIDTSNDPTAAAQIELELANIHDISITRSGIRYIEVRPKGSNKGIALERIANDTDLTRDEILALGDNDNDSEMLTWAGIGVAISEASPTALTSSDYVCHYGVYEGVVEALRLVRLARRYFFHPTKKQQVLDEDEPHRTVV